MRRIAILFIFMLIFGFSGRVNAQYMAAAGKLPDEVLATLESKLDEYFAALGDEPVEVKIEECDYMITNCADSLVKQYVTLRLFDHFMTSKLMGDEAVAVHVVDEWLASGKVKMTNEYDLINAKVYADFHRNNLLGMKAPVLDMISIDGSVETLPAKGKISVLYFYDIGCRKCMMETIMLRNMLYEKKDIPIEFFAVYVGENEQQWKSYAESDMVFDAPHINMHHLWDPDYSSDFQKQYGVLQTPRMFLVAPDGELIGTGLDTQALSQLMSYAAILQDMYDRAPIGGKMPKLTVPATRYNGHKVKEGKFRLDRFRGKPGYIMFHTEGCRQCAKMTEELEPLIEAGMAKLLLVNVDKIFADDRTLATQLFNCFDLSVLPLLVEVDGKKTIKRKSNRLYDE